MNLKQSITLNTPIFIKNCASVVGPKEGEGPLSKCFDYVYEDAMAGEETWEKAEGAMVSMALSLVLEKSSLKNTDIDCILAGDLLNQSISSAFGVKDFSRPFIGIFGACSAMGLSMATGSLMLQAGFGQNILVEASSHFCAAEKQFRFPLELGIMRPPTSSWTVTGAGAAVLTTQNVNGPRITSITLGKIVDLGITDANNMGAAMAPAAADTILTHLNELGLDPSYYDMILTGDLGHIGHELALNLMDKEGVDISKNYEDCGRLIFDRDTQETNAGGSGCACSAVTFAGLIYDKLLKKELNKVLFVPTGALMSPTSLQQGSNILGIAHAVAIENGG